MGPDLVDVLAAEHAQFERLLGDDATLLDDRRLAVTIAEIVRHGIIEEDYLYPLVGEALPDGPATAAAGLAMSQRTETLMKELERTPPGPEREHLVMGLASMVREHIRGTESEIFPALREACDPLELERLAGMAELARTTAPTHPHPGAPHSSPWALIVTPTIGLVDKVRDALTGRLR